jgi:hypothetical protein
MPYGRSYRKKAKKAFKKYANKRVAKRVGQRVVGKFIPGYNAISTAQDVYWLGSRGYRLLKNRQLKNSDKTVDAAMNRSRSDSRPSGRGRRIRRYGIDDYY